MLTDVQFRSLLPKACCWQTCGLLVSKQDLPDNYMGMIGFTARNQQRRGLTP